MNTRRKAAKDPFDEHARRAERSHKDFERRKKAAIEGLHLPTDLELLAGMPFLGEDIQRDMHAFAERLLPRLRKRAEHVHIAVVVDRLEQLTVGAGVEEVRSLADALRDAADVLPSGARSWRLRCRLYLAHLGDHDAALDVARDAVTLAASPARFGGSTAAAVAHGPRCPRLAVGRGRFRRLRMPRRRTPAAMPGSGTTRHRRHRRTAHVLVGLIEQQALVEAEETGGRGVREQAGDVPVTAAVEQPQGAPALSAVVFRDIGNAITGEGKKVEKELSGPPRQAAAAGADAGPRLASGKRCGRNSRMPWR